MVLHLGLLIVRSGIDDNLEPRFLSDGFDEKARSESPTVLLYSDDDDDDESTARGRAVNRITIGISSFIS